MTYNDLHYDPQWAKLSYNKLNINMSYAPPNVERSCAELNCIWGRPKSIKSDCWVKHRTLYSRSQYHFSECCQACHLGQRVIKKEKQSQNGANYKCSIPCLQNDSNDRIHKGDDRPCKFWFYIFRTDENSWFAWLLSLLYLSFHGTTRQHFALLLTPVFVSHETPVGFDSV